ncbi:MAG: FimB/Mfa2 family fimbrial subunit [Prevotella sp.]|nr:FimB/Mfa2 family fimbrial subunit [Prevotella sp.]
MKKLKVLCAAMVLVASGCESEKKECVTEDVTAPVTVSVSGFSVEQGDIAETRATTVGEYNNLKALTLAFYKSDGSPQFKATQYKNDASTYDTFGEFSTSLPIGHYTMVVLGCSSENAAGNILLTGLTSAGYDDYVRETFSASQAVTVSNSSAQNLSITLNRIMAKVKVVSTDGRTADVHAIRTTFSGGSKVFDPTSGLATDNHGIVNTVVTNAPIGNTTVIGNGVFLLSDEQTMDVTVETLDADEHVLFSKTLSNVPLKRNRETTLTGAMYAVPVDASAGSFLVNSDWLEGNSINF